MNIGCITLVEYQHQLVAIQCAKGRGIILPGGKWEKGETFTQTAKREFKEETGLDVVLHNRPYVFGAPDGSGYYVHTFSGTLISEFKENVTPEGSVVLATWKDLFQSTFKAYYELLRMHWVD